VAVEVQRRFWQQVRAGLSVEESARVVGVACRTGKGWFATAGGVIPSIVNQPRGNRLTLAEREEIACRRAAGAGVRQIARELARPASTISRELARNTTRRAYRASTAQAAADRRARRPKLALLATNLPLRQEVQRRLRLSHSPEQIAARLRLDYPDQPEMWVSAETIYQSIYVQGRGALKRDLAKHLRTGRALRKPRRQPGHRRRRITDMVNIAERPAEAAERTVPGHWEGDLITGAGNASAIGTLVERTTGFVILLHLPGDHGALAVQHAMITAVSALPATLRRSLTWDQGIEMANHVQIAAATELDIYFCDPHSPWQRPVNENTNGLLRQYFPKGSDLSVHGPGILEHVAVELNNRPRKRLGWATPAQALDALLSQPTDPHGVASTA
jgi:IS30 family transposase